MKKVIIETTNRPIENRQNKQNQLYGIVKHSVIAIDVLFVIVAFIFYLNLLPSFWDITWIFGFVALVNVLFLMMKINKYPEDKREETSIVYWMSHVFILTLIVITLNQFLKRVIITQFTPELTIFAIATGFLTFYANKNKVEQELENEKEAEERKEKQRKDEFDSKFKWLTKFNIPYGFSKVYQGNDGLITKIFKMLILIVACPFIFLIRIPYSLVKWMYKEGWCFSIPFVIIAIIFIVIKIGMPMVYSGSYIDEYYHILSGVEFFKTSHFAEFYKGSYYTRGAYVSILVGLFMWIFGKTIFVAKMVPALLGIVNLFLLFAIAKKIIAKKPYILLLMIIYTVSPWVIFNHFYIRVYVFYEFFILILFYTFIKIYENKFNNKGRLVYYLPILIINLINYIFSVDTLRYAILFFTILATLFIELDIITKKKILFKVIALLLLLTSGFFVLDVPGNIEKLTSGTLQYTSTDSYKYDYFFFTLNILFTILFFVACLIKLVDGLPYKWFFFSAFLILMVHLISNSEMQIIRGFLYFIPLYYLIAIYQLNYFKKTEKYFIFIIMILLILGIANNFPQTFFKAPGIPGEVHYTDYKKSNDYLISNCKNKEIISMVILPDVNSFYGVNVDEQMYLQKDLLSSDINYYYNLSDNMYKTVYRNIPTNTESNSLKLINKSGVCLIINPEYTNSWRYVSESDFSNLPSSFRYKLDSEQIVVYHN